ncbi:DUF1566 domain-containing protein [Paraferrimonas haliotis]|uniref:Fibronectin type-III domain-containing protein n=1 Tax=Paraferrimonas haliotis TaxID=2013866 RepID=A0AA37TSP8_9GAMM|nr:DUF1566 domain-containing protein [Paraferrimonas haliotis]GLS83442.1 hypothetical protein GCM10007894_14190 [Paraferrimonas haliotis]
MEKMLTVIVLIGALVGCGGNNNTEKEQPLPPVMKPSGVSIETEHGNIIVNWEAHKGLSYDLYISTDKNFDFENYNSFENSEWIKNVSSPYRYTPQNLKEVYFIRLVAVDGERESEASEIEEVVARYEPNGAVVLDLADRLIWARCGIGQSWNELDNTCEGDLTLMTHVDAMKYLIATEGGWRLPTRDELMGLVYCPTGVPSYFLTEVEESCDSSDKDDWKIYEPVFPMVGSYSVYRTSTRWHVQGVNQLFFRQVGFLDGNSNISANEPVAVAVRLVKDNS